MNEHKQRINLNSLDIHRVGDTIFIPLPAKLRWPIVTGCSCPFCKSHPDKKPCWDTLALAANRLPDGHDFTWTVHYPELGKEGR